MTSIHLLSSTHVIQGRGGGAYPSYWGWNAKRIKYWNWLISFKKIKIAHSEFDASKTFTTSQTGARSPHCPHLLTVWESSGQPKGFPFSHDIELFEPPLYLISKFNFFQCHVIWAECGMALSWKKQNKKMVMLLSTDGAYTDVQVTPSICTNSPHMITDLITRAPL